MRHFWLIAAQLRLAPALLDQPAPLVDCHRQRNPAVSRRVSGQVRLRPVTAGWVRPGRCATRLGSSGPRRPTSRFRDGWEARQPARGAAPAHVTVTSGRGRGASADRQQRPRTRRPRRLAVFWLETSRARLPTRRWGRQRSRRSGAGADTTADADSADSERCAAADTRTPDGRIGKRPTGWETPNSSADSWCDRAAIGWAFVLWHRGRCFVSGRALRVENMQLRSVLSEWVSSSEQNFLLSALCGVKCLMKDRTLTLFKYLDTTRRSAPIYRY